MKMVLAAMVALALAVPVGAVEFRSDAAASVPANTAVDDDLFIAGSNVDVRGRVAGSAFAAGGEVNVAAPVDGLLAAAGSTVTVTGPQKTVAAAGTNVRLRSVTARNAMLAGTNVDLDPASSISRDVLAAGTNVKSEAKVGRNIRAAGTNISIGGNVGGDAYAYGANVSVLPGTVIRGRLVFQSPNAARIASDAKIMGGVTHKPPQPRRRGAGWLLFGILRFVAMLLFGVISIALFPRWSAATGRRIIESPGWSVLWGLVVLIVPPIAALIALVTLIGIPIGVTISIAWIIALMLAAIVTSIAVGSLVLRGGSIWLQFILGLFIVYILSAIPYLGILVRIAVILFGLGAIWTSIVRIRQEHALQPAPVP